MNKIVAPINVMVGDIKYQLSIRNFLILQMFSGKLFLSLKNNATFCILMNTAKFVNDK